MDPAMQQFLQAQTPLLQNLSNTVTNLQAHINNQNQQQPPQQPPRDKHRVFSHAANPLEAEDWLKTVEKMLTIT